jgi:hypothetical protein
MKVVRWLMMSASGRILKGRAWLYRMVEMKYSSGMRLGIRLVR